MPRDDNTSLRVVYSPKGGKPRLALAAALTLLAAAVQPATGRAVSAGAHVRSVLRASGCHAWAPVFRPVLPVLGAGSIEVALPAYLPSFGHAVYAHANVDQPPKTYKVYLTTRRTDHIALRDVVLLAEGTAGNTIAQLGRNQTLRSNGRTLHLHADARRWNAVSWFYRGGGITYSVSAPTGMSTSVLVHIAASLTPGPLRRTPITAGTAIPGVAACP